MRLTAIILILFFLLFAGASYSAETNGMDSVSSSGSKTTENPKDDNVNVENNITSDDNGEPSGNDEANVDEIYLTFQYSGVVNTLLTCYYKEDKAFVPIDEIFNLLQINNTESGKTLKGFYLTQDNDYELNGSNYTLSFAGEDYKLDKSEIINVNNKVYISPDVLKKGFNLDLNVNMETLEIKLYTDETMPILANAKRKSVRNQLMEKESMPEAPLLFERQKKLINGEFVDYFLSANYADKINPNYNFNLTSGSELFGGDLNVNLRGNYLNSVLGTSSDFTYRQVFGENKYINQVVLGTNLSTNGINPSAYRGISITNAPFQINDQFGKYLLIDRTIPLSDVELYINNELFDYVKADELGNYKFQIPLTYGSNTVELKIYSPDGQLIVNDRRLQIPFDFLQEKEIRYNLGLGQSRDNNDSKTLSASIGYGVTPWLTTKAGVDYTDVEAFRKPVFYNSLSARISSEYLMNLVVAPEAYNQLYFSGSYFSMQSFGVRYTKYKENKIFNPRSLKEDLQINASLPLTFVNNKYNLQFAGLYEKTETAKNFKVNVGGNFSLFDFNPSFSYTFFQSSTEDTKSLKKELLIGFNTPVFFLNSIFPYFEGKFFNTTLKYDAGNKELASYKISYSNNITSNSRIEFNYSNDLAAKYTSFNVLFKYDFPFTTTNIIASKNSFSGNIHGTLGYDGSDKNIFFSERQSVGTSGIAFRMYADENGNQKYDSTELILDDVNLNFEQNVTFTRKENGVLLATDLNPYYKYVISVKDLSPKNPFLIPKYDRFALVTDPNSIKTIDIPFYYSQEIYGSITAEKNNKIMALPDVKVKLVSEETGKTVSISSYNDGSLYYLGLLPGKYKAYVDPDMIKRLSAVSTPESIDFELKEDGGNGTELNFLLSIGNNDNNDEELVENENENQNVIKNDDQLADFRNKFIQTEKRINSRVGTPAEAHKTFFDEIAATETKGLPEFIDRYAEMKQKLEAWEMEAPQITEEKEASGYTVVKGDCLWKIAGMQKHYDNPHLWPAIWEANKDGIVSAPGGVKTTIPNPNLIYPGQVLRIPKLSDKEAEQYLNNEGDYYKRWKKK